MEGKWHINRAGLINYWYFDTQYFNFADGKVLFRGANGSGKSVTTASLFPVLLDGNTSPNRLDPFGSSARKLEDYLLGEKEVSGIDDRTGYLFAEYKQEDQETYLTTGIGIRAKRGRPLDKWYFILLDNRRVGIDFELQHDLGRGQFQPYSKKELENRVAQGSGEVTDKRKEYATWVNKHLYRFENTDIFEEMIQLQIEIRKPKLSKDFTPTVIYSILENSLPALKDEDLISVSESLENIDRAKVQLESAKNDFKILSKIEKKYGDYHDLILHKLAHHTQKTSREYIQIQKENQNSKRTIEDLRLGMEEDTNLLKERENERSVVSTELEELKKHDVFLMEKQLHELRNHLNSLETKEEEKRRRYVGNEKDYHNAGREKYEIEEALKASFLDRDHALADLGSLCSETGFHTKHELFLIDYQREKEELNLSLWKKETKEYLSELEHIQRQLKQEEKKKEQLSSKAIQIGEVCRQMEGIDQDIKKWSTLFLEDREKIRIQIEKWCNHAPYPFSQSVIRDMTAILFRLYEDEAKFYDIKRYAEEESGRYVEEKRRKKLRLEQSLENCRQLEEELEAELDLWRNKTVPEPDRDPYKKQEHESLARKGKHFSYLYELIDFKERLDQEEKNRIEGAMLDSGILDCIVCEERLRLEESAQIFPSLPVKDSLAQYFIVMDNERVSREYVEKILRSIAVDKSSGNLSISKDGQYRLGIVEGKSTLKHGAKFIGKEAQLRYIQTQIEKIAEELDKVYGEASEFENAISSIEEELRTEFKRLEEFPQDADLRFSHQNIEKLEIERHTRVLKQEEYESQYKLIQEEIAEIRQEYYRFEREYEIKCNAELIEAAVEKMKEYGYLLEEMGDVFKEIVNGTGRLQDKEKTLSIARNSLEDLEEELQELKWAIDKDQKRIESMEARLQLSNVDEIRMKIRQSQVREEFLYKERDRLNKSIAEKGVQIKTQEERQESLQRGEVFFEELSRQWKELFFKEYLRYREEGEEEEILKEYARGFEPSLGNRESDKNNEVQALIRSDTHDLSGYSPEINESFEIDISPLEKLDERREFSSEIEVLRSNSKRNLLSVLDEQNRRTDVFRVVASLQISIEEQERYIRQEDRNLFEHILLDSTGRIIKGLINSAEKWTKKMNDVLQRQNNYRGLKLLIEWKPKTAENEQEVGTRELVELLRRPSESLTNDDFDRIVAHFRLKIDQAKIDMEQDEDIRSLHDIMKRILDYRRWFQFVIKYEKDNQSIKELSNHIFNKFSGGEKAISMYLPLFTAIYSRYEDASKNAPYIVVLDEAFAGVDEINIAELFKAMEDLGFDYVLNSQSLWGDYSTVKDLMIYQLIRERGSDIVVSREYRWNGRERREGQEAHE